MVSSMALAAPPSRDLAKLQAECAASGGAYRLTLDGRAVSLTAGTHFFFSAAGAAAAAGKQ